jgi:hypothetical protein
MTNFTDQQINEYIVSTKNEDHSAVILLIARTINKLELWSWLKTFQPEHGFFFSEHENTKKIIDKVSDFMSPTAFAIIMRLLQSFAKNNIIGDEIDCSICLERNTNEGVLLSCNHSFHYSCLQNWSINNSCPLCRQKTVPGYL